MFDAFIIADGDIPPPNFWQHFNASTLICTDGAALSLIEMSIVPNVIVGDMDSIADNQLKPLEAIKAQFPNSKLIKIDDQNTTDFEKALQYTNDNGIKSALCLGLLGKSADHSLHNLGLLGRFSHHLSLYALHTYNHTLQWILPLRGSTTISTTAGATLSLFPLSPCVISTQGLKWDLKEKLLSASGHNSIRNQTVTELVQIHCQGECLCFILAPRPPVIKI